MHKICKCDNLLLLEVKILYFDKETLENTEICEYACVVYESCASLSPDGYLIQ